MVTRYGFSSLGPVALEADAAEVFLGRDWLRSEPHYSRETGNRIDTQVQALARQALEQAVALLSPRRTLMDALVNQLIERETIEGPAFSAIVERFEQGPAAPAPASAALPV
jgi:cell division protease FtsH